MTLIYTNNIKNDSFLNYLFEGLEYSVTENIYNFLHTVADNKIAFMHDVIGNSKHHSVFAYELNFLCSHCNLVILFGKEFHGNHVEMLEIMNGKDNFYYISPAILYYDHLQLEKNLFFWGHWLDDNSRIYKKLDYKLNDLLPYNKKPYYFDALLGTQKDHRQFVYDKITSSDFSQKFIFNYGNDVKNLIIDSDVIIPNNIKQSFSMNYFDYNGVDCLLCQIIPTEIYKTSAYTIVAETNYINLYFFPTDKIAKPILARRLFVVFAQWRYLKYLKDLGFRTFDSIIDESYDEIRSENDRWMAAWEQVVWLCNQEQEEILDKIKQICDYNYNHLMTTDWNGIVRNKLRNIIDINI